ncbi:MAG: hypothetical protein K6360_00320 [Deltaproteobacteria bacterium]
MRKSATFLITGLIFLLVETTWGCLFEYGTLRFQGIAALVVWYGARVTFLKGISPVLALGVLASAFTVLPAWIYVSHVAAGYVIVRYIVRNVILGMLWQWMLLVFFVAAAMIVFLMTASGVLDFVWPWGILQAGLDALLCPIMFFVLDRLDAAAFRSVKEDA